MHVLTGIQVGFGELDYRGIEGNKQVSIVVQKKDQNANNLTLKIQTLTFDELELGLKPQDVELPDAAECKTHR